MVGYCFQAEGLQELLGTRVCLLGVRGAAPVAAPERQPRAKTQMFACSQFGTKYVLLLDEDGARRARRPAGDHQADAARVRRGAAGQAAQQRRLAGARRAQQRERAARFRDAARLAQDDASLTTRHHSHACPLQPHGGGAVVVSARAVRGF